MKLTCGVDWAEAHHDVALVDGDGVVVARARIDTGATGFNKLLALIAEHERQRPRHAEFRSKQTRTCSSSRWSKPGSRYIRSTRGRWPAIGNATARPAASPIPAMRQCSRTFCAPTDICTARCQRSASRDAQSRRWPVSTKRRSGRCTKPSAVYDRCCWSSIRKRCKHFRISHTRQH